MLVDEPAQVVVDLATETPQAQGTCPGVWYTTVEPHIMVMLNVTKVNGVT